jgi:hypothetical protein
VPPELAQAFADQENEELAKPTAASDKPSRPHGRGKPAEHLPVERIELEPPEALRSCPCCGEAKTKIGEETSSRLDYRPSSLVHVQIARIKYAPTCKCEEGGVVIASVQPPILPSATAAGFFAGSSGFVSSSGSLGSALLDVACGPDGSFAANVAELVRFGRALLPGRYARSARA